MKVLLRREHKPRYPKHRLLRCSKCHTWMYAGITDCKQGKTVLNLPAIYVDCPNCGESHHYHDGYMSEALRCLNKG